MDYGRGTGAIAARLRELGHRAVGADLSAEMLEMAVVMAALITSPAQEWRPEAGGKAGWPFVVSPVASLKRVDRARRVEPGGADAGSLAGQNA